MTLRVAKKRKPFILLTFLSNRSCQRVNSTCFSLDLKDLPERDDQP